MNSYISIALKVNLSQSPQLFGPDPQSHSDNEIRDPDQKVGTFRSSKAIGCLCRNLEAPRQTLLKSTLTKVIKFFVLIELVHEQLPLPVPCYDLAHVTEPSLRRPRSDFSYSRLPWLDGRLCSLELKS